MAYATASDVGALTKSLLGEFVEYNKSSCPTILAVNNWLSSGCSIIEGRLAGGGYSTPVASTAGAFGWIKDLNTLFGAARAEMSRSTVVLSPGERTRGQVFEEMFWDGLEQLISTDLTNLGLTKTSNGNTMYSGGKTVSDKQSKESDTDRVNPRFTRGMSKFPGTIDPDGTTASRFT